MPIQPRRRALLLGAAALPLCPAVWARSGGAPGVAFAGSTLRFAEPDEARRLLAAADDWMLATGAFQRRATMGRDSDVTFDAFRRWNADAVQPWAEAQRERWREALRALEPGWRALRIPLPREVLLVASNGQESAGAPYTRAHAVVLAGRGEMPGYTDAMLLAHELWHVASRRAPALATRLYARIGFEPMPRLEFPRAWAERRLANPDAPHNRHAMRLVLDGREARVTPVLVAARTTLKPGETFFDVLDVRLLEVRPDGDVSRAVLREGEPRWHAPGGPHDYLQRLGGNTEYVIHPEETMADNVMLLAGGLPGRNPDLLARLREVFDAQPR